MTAWIGILVDAILVIVVGIGIYQASRLINQLRDLRASRGDMDRFVHNFNAAVIRAESGIKALRAAARDSGDDLEKLVERSIAVRDELNFIVESADKLAERISVSATNAIRADKEPQQPASKMKPVAAVPVEIIKEEKTEAPTTSRAEKDLLQALQKLK